MIVIDRPLTQTARFIPSELINELRSEVKRQFAHIDDSTYKGIKEKTPGTTYILRYADGIRFLCMIVNNYPAPWSVHVTRITRSMQRHAGRAKERYVEWCIEDDAVLKHETRASFRAFLDAVNAKMTG